MGSVNISKYQSVYIDTSIYIYFFEDNSIFGSLAEDIFSQIIDKQIIVYSSEILFTELLVTPIKEKNKPLIQLYENLNSVLPTLNSVSVSHDISVSAANLRATFGLRTPDAIHLATAMDQKAEAFIHSDNIFSKVKEIKTLDVSRL